MTNNFTPTTQALQASSHLFSGNSAYLEALYEQYLQDPQQLSPFWQQYLAELTKGQAKISHAAIQQEFIRLAQQHTVTLTARRTDTAHEAKTLQVVNLVMAYRTCGHFQANLDPLGLAAKPDSTVLQLETYGLGPSDLDHTFFLHQALGLQTATLRTVIATAQSIYCGSLGFEYQHISDQQQKEWLCQHIEAMPSALPLSVERKRRILKSLLQAEGLEKYLAAKFVAQKRFSLEGGDSLLPMLDTLVQAACRLGVREIILGMAHRGRINVLVNILGKPIAQLCEEFEGHYATDRTDDVKYHKGFATELSTPYGTIHVMMGFNPSHLESINPVIQGMVRARQDQRQDQARCQVLPVLLHGDAALAGQGIVMETLQLAQTIGSDTGGTVHIVSNNQIGFTTDPQNARSSWYCTDIAKFVDVPIFHVNGDDPEAAVWVTQLALEFRQCFKKDVVIDLVCYRRYGHNEADEPVATQPLMYQTIRALASVGQRYAERLMAQKVVDSAAVEALASHYRQLLDSGQVVIAGAKGDFYSPHLLSAATLTEDWRTPVDTRITLENLHQLAEQWLQLPPEMTLQTQVAKLYEDRRKMAKGTLPLNWGYAEALAYASLLQQNYTVRLSGQDCARGTFFHRHAVLHDCRNNQTYIPLAQFAQTGRHFTVVDSILAEAGVMGFEYGYACAYSQALVIWEAQYGDFVNGAQVIIDQYLSASEQKWGQLCGLVLFLPHGYEGSGPEHSSARLERFLQLCAQQNMQVCVPTTPAQIFHLLRRQMLRPYRKPLVVMTPKSLLRHRLAVSSLVELAQGQFQTVITETDPLPTEQVSRIVLCSGKVYYELLMQRRLKQQEDVAILRIEQLYPFPDQELQKALQPYTEAKTLIWCQEEPENQGAWRYMQACLQTCLTPGQILHYCSRPAAAAPAVGSPLWHEAQQQTLVRAALLT